MQIIVGYLRLVGSLNLTLDLLNPIFCLILIGMRREIFFPVNLRFTKSILGAINICCNLSHNGNSSYLL